MVSMVKEVLVVRMCLCDQFTMRLPPQTEVGLSGAEV